MNNCFISLHLPVMPYLLFSHIQIPLNTFKFLLGGKYFVNTFETEVKMEAGCIVSVLIDWPFCGN